MTDYTPILLMLTSFSMFILCCLNAVSKNDKSSRAELIGRITAVFLSLAIFAWISSYQGIYTMHEITGNRILINDKTVMTTDYFKQTVLDTLPPQTYEGIAQITLTNHIKGQNEQYKGKGFETLGIYYEISHTVELLPEAKHYYLSPTEFKRNMAHEAAHWYWFDRLTPAQRAQWTQLYQSTQNWASEYATSDEKEDFAETVSFIIVNRAVVTDPAKIAFIEQNYLKPLNITFNETKSSTGNFYVFDLLTQK